MSSLTGLILSPFALLFRVSYAYPILAILISGLAGTVAAVLHQDYWTLILVSFASYMMIWLDESRAGREPAADLGEE
jgi:hypothetical protein